MKVTVIGATGQIGGVVVADLLTEGHAVTAYVRNPAKLDDHHPALSTVTGELSEAENVSRFIGLATPSVADVRDQPTLKARVLPVVARLMFPNALDELVGMTTAVTESGLDWTIARITSPNSTPSKGSLRAGYLGRDKVGSAMSRADIAAFLVAQLTDDRFSRAAPAISN